MKTFALPSVLLISKHRPNFTRKRWMKLELAIGVLMALLGGGVSGQAQVTVTTNYTTPGGPYTFTVPGNVTSINVEAIGGAGATYTSALLNHYSRADQVSATLPVTPGQTLYIYVAGHGQPGTAGARGGANGGGNGGSTFACGGGGGASDIRNGNTNLSSRIIVAAGGGGGEFNFDGGNARSPGQAVGTAAQPGTATAGGSGGAYFSSGSPGSPGTFGAGGNGGGYTSANAYGGGGGGGWYGGGGGSAYGSGAGGSSYADSSASSVVIGLVPPPTTSALTAPKVAISYIRLPVAPVIACPSDVTTNADAGRNTVKVNYSNPSVLDGEPAPYVACSPASGSTFSVGNTAVTCTGTNNSGTSTCSFTVKVLDTELPSITCPASREVYAGLGLTNAVVTFTATATDNATPNPAIVCVPASGSAFNLGTTPVICRATDASGNSNSCSFQIVVKPLVVPAITCPGNVTNNADTGLSTVTVNYPNPIVAAGDPAPFVSCSPESGSVFSIGTSVVTCSATNIAGGGTCSFSVTVVDAEAPTITCPANLLVATDVGTNIAVVHFTANASDNADPNPAVTCAPPSGSSFSMGTNLVTCRATDISGNSSDCSFKIVVVPLTRPAALCRDISVGAPVGETSALVAWMVSTNFPAPVVTCTLGGTNISSPFTFPLGESRVSCTASNGAGTDDCSFTVSVSCTPASLDSAEMVADIDFGDDGSYPEGFINFRGALYFTASDEEHGSELRRFDGTNVTLVWDIFPGPEGSYIGEMTIWNGALYFSAEDPCHGKELWRYDGTNASRIADIYPGSDGSYPYELTQFKNALYFYAREPEGGAELWKFNGTNVSRAADINTGPYDSSPYYFTVFQNALYFQAYEPEGGTELWKFDGTNASRAADIKPGPDSSEPTEFFVFNNALYFAAYGPDTGRELWKFDGTNASLAADMNPGPESSWPWEFTIFQNAVYFQAWEPVNGGELWRFDGTNAALAADINPGWDNSNPYLLTVFQNKLYFTAYSPGYGQELWSVDGTNPPVAIDVNPGPPDSYPAELSVQGNALYFTADSGNGYKLQKFDGQNPSVPREVKAGQTPYYPTDFITFNGQVYFAAGGPLGNEFWRLNESSACVTNSAPTIDCPGDLVLATRATSCDAILDFTNRITGYPVPSFGCTLNGNPIALPMRVDAGIYNVECMAANVFGSASCSFRVTVEDRTPPVLSCPPDLVVACDVLVPPADFAGGQAIDACDGTVTPTLLSEVTNSVSPLTISRTWVAQDSKGNLSSCVQRVVVGATAGMVTNIRRGSDSAYPEEMTEFRGALYFQASDGIHGYELWRYNGTNVELVADIDPGRSGSYPEDLVVFKNALYFSADDDVHGYELWKYDGTNTTLVADINPGQDDSYPASLRIFNGALYFQAEDPIHGSELWKYDGTNVALVADISPSYSSYPYYLTVYKNALYFQAADDEHGYELWKYDGTNATMVADLNPGWQGAYPSELITWNGSLFFTADDGMHGEELWKYDGTNLTLVADIDPTGGSYPEYMTVFNDALYFSAYRGDLGTELWKFNGTNATLVADIQAGSGDSYPENFTVVGNSLYFSAQNELTGGELWRYDGTNAPQVLDLLPGPNGSWPDDLAVYNGTLFFQAYNDEFGTELWQLGRPNQACPIEAAPALACSNLVVMSDPGYCSAYLDVRPFPNVFPFPEVLCVVNGDTLYGSYGFAAGTTRVDCVAANIYGSDSCSFTVTVMVPPEQFGIVERFQTLAPVTPDSCCRVTYPFSVDQEIVGLEFNSRFYYSASREDKGRELWTYDGTNSFLAADINPGGADSNPAYFTVFSNTLYFAASDGTHGAELWKYDGPNATLASDIAPGATGSSPAFLKVFNDSLYFVANDGSSGQQVWKYNGVSATSVTSFPTSQTVRDLVVYSNMLYCVAGNDANAQLWQVTPNGAVQVTFISPGIDVARSWVATLGSDLYFTADDGVHGMELWKYNGTSATRLTDIYPGSGNADPSWLTAYDNALYFAAAHPVLGQELWRYDGTNTMPVLDFRLGNQSSRPHSLIVFSNALYFAAIEYDYDFGFGADARERLFRFDGERFKVLDGNGMCQGKILSAMSSYGNGLLFLYSDDCQFYGTQQLARMTRNYDCKDDDYPGLYCPGDVSVEVPEGECGAWFVVPATEYGFPDPSVVCRSGGTVFSLSHFFPVGIHSITCIASNRYDENECTFTLRVEAPISIACPGNITTNIPSSASSAVVSFAPTVISTCTPFASVTCSPPSGAEFQLGTTQVYCETYNNGGSGASCSFSVTVAPNNPPVVVCHQNVLALDGVNGRVRVAGFGNYAPTEQITIEFWQKIEAAADQSTFTLDPDNGDNRINAHVPWSDGGVYWDFGTVWNDGRAYYPLNSGAIGTWQHFALISDRSQYKMQIYRNGLLEHEEGHAGIFYRDNYDLLIGGKEWPLKGQLAEFRVWEGVRSGTEILSSYKRRLTGTEPGLLAYYPLNELSGTTAHDLCTNANHGTLEGGAAWLDTTSLVVTCEPDPLLIPSCRGVASGLASITNLVIDPEGNEATVVWIKDGVSVQTNTVPAGQPPTATILTFDTTYAFGDHTVILVATDSLGDSSFYTNVVRVIDGDHTPPGISCPDTVFAAATNGNSAIATFLVTASDNCDTNPLVNCAPPSGSPFPVGTNAVLCSAADASGNTNACSFAVVIRDAAPPAMTCPGTVFVSAGNDCSAVVNYDISASDISGVASTNCTPPSGSVFPLGANPVVCTAVDNAGNTNSCSFTVSVQDVTPPMLTCSTNILVDTADSCSAIVDYSVSVTDNCTAGFAICVPPSGSVFPAGTNIVRCTAADLAGNTNSCAFSVTVREITPPNIVCPGDQVVSASSSNCFATVTFAVSASDDCDVASTNCVPPSGSSFPIGTNIVVCSAVDRSGNTNSCAFRIIVRDVTPPVISCASNVVADVGAVLCSATVNYNVSASDNCGVISTNCIPPLGAPFAVGTHSVSCFVFDAAGNRDSCSFTVTVRDTFLPVITCPADMVVSADSHCSAMINYNVTVNDNCFNVTTNCVPPSGAVLPIGTNQVLCTAVDLAGNSNSCAFSVTVVDDTPPIVLCPGNQVVSASPTNCSATVSYTVSGSDNCGVVSTNCVPPSGSSFPLGTNTVVCSVIDFAGNTNSCAFNVAVLDTTPPVLVCPQKVTVRPSSGDSNAVAAFTVTATDNCASPLVICEPPSGTSFPLGTNLVSCSAGDIAGNTNTCSFAVIVEESSPVALLHWKFEEPSGLVALDSSGNTNTGVLLNGPVRTNSVAGRALRFDGSNDRVQASNAISLNITGAFTAACWIRPESVSSSVYLLIKGNDSSDKFSYAMRANNARLEYRWVSPAGTRSSYKSTTNVLVANRWTHVAVAHTPGATPILFVNGVQVPGSISSGSATALLGTSPNPFSVGASADGSDEFKGAIDEVFLCPGALAAAQIRNLTNGLPPGASPPLPPPVIITADPLANGEVGTPYSLSLLATGGTPGFTWSIAGNSLPDGLALTANGLITGIPSRAVTNTFRVLVRDAAAQTAEKNFTLAITDAPTEPSGSDCLLVWSFDEGSGSVALDSSGNNYHGVLLNGPTRTNGVLGKALRFDGSNDRVSATNKAALNVAGALTVACWARPETVSGSRYLIIKGDQSDEAYSYALRTSDAKLQYRWVSSGGTENKYVTSNNVLTNQQWTHFAVVHVPGNLPTMYVNGIAVRGSLSSGSASALRSPSSNPFTVGSSSDGSDRFLGSIDEVTVCAKALTAGEILALRNRGLPTPLLMPFPDLVAPAVITVRVADGLATISWNAEPGRSYQVQYKDDLSEVEWRDFTSPIYPTDEEAAVQDLADPGTQRFYRVISQ